MARVVFTEPAEYDLLDIEYYIFVDLCNPQAAHRISNGILDTANRLAEYPAAHPLVNDELLRGCLPPALLRYWAISCRLTRQRRC